MSPARTYPARRDDVRLLVVDATTGALRETRTRCLPDLLAPGDLLVMNDAATLPAALRGHDEAGNPLEARLAAAVSERGPLAFWAVLFGTGDWRQRTEERPAPTVALGPGARIAFGGGADPTEATTAPAPLLAEVLEVSPVSSRLVCLRFVAPSADAFWAALYQRGRPIQYSYLEHTLPLWAVQNVYAGRPWAFEMPSAGRPLSWEILFGLQRRGVSWASLTHAAGLSSTGDPAVDAALPLPERFDIPESTARAVVTARQSGGRVIAVGTTVVRALEGSAAVQAGGVPRPGVGVTDLHIGPGFTPRVVDGILSGTHTIDESHFSLLAAFVSGPRLAAAVAYAEDHAFTTHELGDSMLILPARHGPTRFRDDRGPDARRAAASDF